MDGDSDSKKLKAVQDFEKKVKGITASVGKVLSDEDGQKLRALYRDIPFQCTPEEFGMLAFGLTKAYPNVAFLLIHQEETRFQFVLSISELHHTMGAERSEILERIYKEIMASPIIYRPEIQGAEKVSFPHGVYYARDTTDCDYIGKIVDTINSIVFGYFKQNGYLPTEEDEEDKFLNFDEL